MIEFVRTKIKPLLGKMHIYDFAYRFYYKVLYFCTLSINFFRKTFFKTAPIFLYHRIDSVSSDPIKLCVTPKTFEEHLIFLKKYYDIIPLSELSDRVMNGMLKGNEAAITFDDGYKDNIKNALPLIEKHNVSVTIFITTGMLGEKADFDWDKEYSEGDRATFLNEEEIRELSAHALVEIGAHTHTHPRLSDLSMSEQKNEIKKSKEILEKITGEKIRSFAYPFGGVHDYNKSSKKAVAELGFDSAYTSIEMFTKSSKDRFSIPRINVQESTAEELGHKLGLNCNFCKKC